MTADAPVLAGSSFDAPRRDRTAGQAAVDAVLALVRADLAGDVPVAPAAGTDRPPAPAGSWRIRAGAIEAPVAGPGGVLHLRSGAGPAVPLAAVPATDGATGAAILRAPVPPALVARRPLALIEAGGGERPLGPYPPAELSAAMLTCFLNRGGGGNPVVTAFARGIGARLAFAEDQREAPDGAALVWGVLRGSDEVVRLAEAAARYWFYVDHAYLNRGHGVAYRIARNAHEAGPVRDCPDDRAARLGVECRPWRTGGAAVLVCPPTDFFMAAHGCPTWLEDTLAALRAVTDRPVEVRRKPAPGEAIEPLGRALQRCHALVTHSSNVAVEAAIAGTPVFVAPSSAAAPVGRTDLSLIERPAYPDRRAWLSHLAYSQFTMAEIADGRAWRLLLENERRPFVGAAG